MKIKNESKGDKIMMITDWETFLLDFEGEKIFHICRYKRMFTPEEIENKYADETTYEEMGDYFIEESIELPDKDVLIGCRSCYEEWEEGVGSYLETGDTIEYFRLSEITLEDVHKCERFEFMKGKEVDEDNGKDKSNKKTTSKITKDIFDVSKENLIFSSSPIDKKNNLNIPLK